MKKHIAVNDTRSMTPPISKYLGADGEDAIRELMQRDIELDARQFLHALHNEDKALIDLFVRANFDIDLKDEQGTPAILIALKKGHTEIAQTLMNAGADINTSDKMWLTPLLVACAKTTSGYETLAEMLIIKGAFINVCDRLGNTPLLLALSGGTVKIAELLIQKGADVFAQTRSGETCLSLAEKTGNTNIVELLLNKGAKW